MGSKQTPMNRLYHAQSKSRVDKIPRIGMSSTGKRYALQVRTELTKMDGEMRTLNFIRETEEGKTLSCKLSFYITGKGKAMVIRSMKWEMINRESNEYMKTPADEASCKIILQELKDIATRHKVPSIYASTRDIASILLFRLGFSPMNARDHLCLEVQESNQKH